uniref:Secreted protein n=2 Tax=Macrostomum lignano TaxID=282301 RepID=A0A1I8F3L0_9PLAT
CVLLLFPDRLTCRSLSDFSESCVFDRCYSLNDELFNVRLSRQFLYLMSSAGDIMLRYRSECYEKGDQLIWRTIGSRTFSSPEVVQNLAKTNRKICQE